MGVFRATFDSVVNINYFRNTPYCCNSHELFCVGYTNDLIPVETASTWLSFKNLEIAENSTEVKQLMIGVNPYGAYHVRQLTQEIQYCSADDVMEYVTCSIDEVNGYNYQCEMGIRQVRKTNFRHFEGYNQTVLKNSGKS
jgi:hypothetical protein